MAVIHVVLCGGMGKRLWPISRAHYPKPFVLLPNKTTLFSETLKRNHLHCDKLMIVTNETHYSLAKGVLVQSDTTYKKDSLFILEPLSKNTANAIALAALSADKDDVLWVSPADHWISNQAVYEQELAEILSLANPSNLITIGINPTSPDTQYGYIQYDEEVLLSDKISCYKVKKFHEKPTLVRAKYYLEEKNYLFNSGMFCFTAGAYLNQLEQYQKKLFEQLTQLHQNKQITQDIHSYNKTEMAKLQSISIDYAVLEKSKEIQVVKSKMKWNDLGQFEQLDVLSDKDEHLNSKGAHILTHDARNNTIYSDNRNIAVLGVDNLVIVDSPDAILVSKKGESSKIQDFVNKQQTQNPTLFENPWLEHRPWGSFRVIKNEANTKVKELIVLPNKRLSLQSHKHRAEHWIVTKGQATVQLDDEFIELNEGQSIDILKEQRHRLENKTQSEIKLIEVQFGTYLGEDDIIRYEDDFERDGIHHAYK